MIRKVLNTLSYRVDKEINESLYQNEVFLQSRWSFIEKSILLWSGHYKKYTILNILLAVLSVVNIILWKPWVKDFIVEYVPHWKELLEWQGGFLAGQLTIVGVVYPLVIGLISILFQNKSAKKTIFPIYQKYSGFMFAGLSGLSLSAFIVVGFFLRAYLDDSTYIAICIVSALWLISNIILTSWFFVQTFRILNDRFRDQLILRYSIHESCERDIRKRIHSLLIQGSIHNKLLSNPDESILSVKTMNYSDNDFEKITRTVGRDIVVKDIRYSLINFAIRIQIWMISIKNWRSKQNQNCTIVIQANKDYRNHKKIIIAQYSGFKINLIVEFLIKSAFSFESKSIEDELPFAAILNAFIGSASDALRDKNATEFADALDHIVDWHTEIALALSFRNDNGKNDNWLLLPSSGFFGRTYLDELISEYYELARDSVERIPENSRFYEKMLYLYKGIYAKRDKLLDQEARTLIRASYYMWYLLMEWHSYSSNSQDVRIANKYEDILYDFVGAWEGWLMYIEPRTKRSGDMELTYPSFIAHLEFTALTAVTALRFNNYEAALWGVDMLNNWLEKLSSDNYWNAEYSWKSVLINHTLLLKKDVDPAWQLILQEQEYDHLAAFYLAFKNANYDLRILTACYIVLKPEKENTGLLVKCVNSLLSSASVHHEGVSGQSRYAVSNAGEVLGAYIRHRDYRYYGDGSYGSWLTKVLDSFGQVFEERRVSGRVYSGWGANDPKSMNEAYVEISISLSLNKWVLPREWEDAILSDAFRTRDHEAIISDLRDWIKIAEEKKSYMLFDEEHAERLISNFIDSVNGIIEKISQLKEKKVAESKIDADRLKQFGITSSKIFKNIPIPQYPLNLFEKLEYKDFLDDKYINRLNIQNYKKEEVAQGVEANRAVNENEWLAGGITNNVKMNILTKLLQYPQTSTVKKSSVNELLEYISEQINFLAVPILFVGNQKLSNALHRISYNKEMADNHAISRKDGFDRSAYICHIGHCEVYNLPFTDVDYSLLTTKELFEKMEIKNISDNQFVQVQYIPDDEKENIGILQLQYWMKIILAENISCIKLELETNELLEAIEDIDL